MTTKIYEPGDYKQAGIEQNEIGAAVRMVGSLVKTGATIFGDRVTGAKTFDTVIAMPDESVHPDIRYKQAFKAIYAARQELNNTVKIGAQVSVRMADGDEMVFSYIDKTILVGKASDNFYSLLGKCHSYVNFKFDDIERIVIRGETGLGDFYEIKSILFVIDPTRRDEPDHFA